MALLAIAGTAPVVAQGRDLAPDRGFSEIADALQRRVAAGVVRKNSVRQKTTALAAVTLLHPI